MNATNIQASKARELLNSFLRGMPELTVSKMPKYVHDRRCASGFKSITEYITKSFDNYIDHVVKEPRLWTEVIPLINGNYAPCFIESDIGLYPATYENECLARLENMSTQIEYLHQIDIGEREHGDCWDGEIYPCEIDGDYLKLFKNDKCFLTLNWKLEA